VIPRVLAHRTWRVLAYGEDMQTVRGVLIIVLIAASAFVVGSGIAALPYMENDPCIGYGTETGPSVGWETSLVPYGTRCVMEGERRSSRTGHVA
jgi:hypothetical protein